jgi:hypothetical protein
VNREERAVSDAKDHHREFVLLCDGCAAEAGAADDSNIVGPGSELHGAACQRCGAIIVGFGHAVPADAWTGMNPGPG